MHRALALIGAVIALPAFPTAAGEADAALSVTAVVLDRCAVAAQVDSAAGHELEHGFGRSVRLSLHCPRQTACAAGFGPMDEPQPVEAAGLDRCRLDVRLRPLPVVTRTPHLFQVDF